MINNHKPVARIQINGVDERGRFPLDVNNLIYINYLDEAMSNNKITVGSTVLVVTENMHYQCYGSDGVGRFNIGGGRYLQKTGYKVFNDTSILDESVDGNDIYDASVGDVTPVGYKTFIELVKLVKKLEKNNGGSTGGGSESI